MCETLRRFARGPDAPQIHLLCVEEASDEVDPPAIARPEREMIMPAGLGLTKIFRGLPPLRSATNIGSPGSPVWYASRAPSGDQARLTLCS